MFFISSRPNSRNMHFVSYSRSAKRLARLLGGPPLRAVVDTQYRFRKIRDHTQRLLRRLAMWLVAGAREDRHVDRAITLLPRDLDLPHGAVLIISALDDRHRHADIGEVLGNIPIPEIRIEPGAVPTMKGVVDILVPAREFGLQVCGLIRGSD